MFGGEGTQKVGRGVDGLWSRERTVAERLVWSRATVAGWQLGCLAPRLGSASGSGPGGGFQRSLVCG